MDHLSDPANDPLKVAIANVTTWEAYKDGTCIIEENDWAELTNRSCVAYEYAKLIDKSAVEGGKKGSLLESLRPVSEDVLKEIREGAIISEHTADDVKRFLIAQQLFDAQFVADHPIEGD